MRKELYRLAAAQTERLLATAPAVHIATTDADGAPMLRTVHTVWHDGALYFHGAPAGEKMEALGRAAVASADEVVANIPSYFVDPERACPATTYYRSAQVHGRLEEVEDVELKAAMLALLMRKYQPEGGHVPLDAASPMYRKSIAGLLVVRLRAERVDGKAKLGQNRKPAELVHVLERLWQRGAAGDARAIDLVRDANPDTPTPAFLVGPAGLELRCSLDVERDLGGAVALLRDAYWNDDVTDAGIAEAQRRASAWVGARDGSGALIACARALSDGGKWAWIYDVMVAPSWRGRGVGQALVRLMLDHPALRGAPRVMLATRDAQTLYARFGFRDAREVRKRPYESTTMMLDRSLAAAGAGVRVERGAAG